MTLPNFSLEGKVALVTGASQGIGRGIALTFAEAGADVAVAARSLADLEKVAGEIRALGRRSLAVQADIALKADIDSMVERTVGELGTIDVLVNAAAVNIRLPLFKTSEEEWDMVMNTDLKGSYLCCQAVGRVMVERKRGAIINITSTNAVKVSRASGAYTVAKAAVAMLTKVLALELAPYNIRVNAIGPGFVRTRLTEWFWTEPKGIQLREASMAPLGRDGKPGDMGNAALFLASDASGFVTGHTIYVDGGNLAAS